MSYDYDLSSYCRRKVLNKLHELYGISNWLCEPNFNDLKKQWIAAKWHIEKANYFVEIPEVHLFIQAFLNSIKTFLDLIVQLISTEKIVSKKIHGFHKKGKNPGGETLDILRNKSTNKMVADNIDKLIEEHKRRWIDDVINARDSLIHPDSGLLQIMFQLEIIVRDSELELKDLKKPSINNMNFDQYAEITYKQLNEFANSFINILKNS